jgi:hypothetical protein
MRERALLARRQSAPARQHLRRCVAGGDRRPGVDVPRVRARPRSQDRRLARRRRQSVVLVDDLDTSRRTTHAARLTAPATRRRAARFASALPSGDSDSAGGSAGPSHPRDCESDGVRSSSRGAPTPIDVVPMHRHGSIEPACASAARPEQARPRFSLGRSHSGESGRVTPCFPRIGVCCGRPRSASRDARPREAVLWPPRSRARARPDR